MKFNLEYIDGVLVISVSALQFCRCVSLKSCISSQIRSRSLRYKNKTVLCFEIQLGGWTIKKMAQNDNWPGPGRNYGETAVFTLSQKVVFGQKSVFLQKKHQKFAKRLIFILEKGSFFSAQLCPVKARTKCPLRSELFWGGPKSRFLGQKSDFCHKNPNFFNGPFIALRETIHIRPSKRFFNFSFPSYGHFCKKNSADASKSLPPRLCGGTICQ